MTPPLISREPDFLMILRFLYPPLEFSREEEQDVSGECLGSAPCWRIGRPLPHTIYDTEEGSQWCSV